MSGVREVVSNLRVADAVAASPPTDRAGAPRDPLRARFPGIVRLDLETGTPGWTRFVAYDRAGRRVATVYAVTDDSLPDLAAAGAAIDHVSLVGAGPRYIVLWHITVDEVSRLE